MSTTTAIPRPDFGRLYGITHDKHTRVPIIRVPRVLKVGIGIPQGRAVQVFLHNGKWHIRHGVWDKSGGKEKLVMKTVYQGGATGPNTREAVEAWHNANKHLAAVSNRPQKIPYFTFTRRNVSEENGKPTENFEPDFEAIEAHGDLPKRVPVILTSENPLQLEHQWWTASELKCHGDGLVAERAVSAGTSKDPGWQAAKNAGERFFPYAPCYATGCPHAEVDCKPHGTINMQLAYAMRIGATAYFTTTGAVSCKNLFASISVIREAVESRGYSIAGIPMELVLSSFKANHNGVASLQPFVSLELRAEGGAMLQKILSENSWVPAQLGTAPKMLPSAIDEGGTTYDASAAVDADAGQDAVDADFDDEAPITPAPVTAATATLAKQNQIGEQLRQKSGGAAWRNEEGMREVFAAEMKRVGRDAFMAVLAKHGKTIETLDPVDSMPVYNAVKALPDELF